MDFYEIWGGKNAFEEKLRGQKASLPAVPWYPYGTLNNFDHISPLIVPEMAELFTRRQRIADVGAADGDLSFYLETFGFRCDLIDYAPTNFNLLAGARALKRLRKSRIKIREVDLDAQFRLSGRYDLIFFLGILYHLKNPFYALERLARHSRYAFLSTRVARRFQADGPIMAESSAAYLLSQTESNNDSTNYWIFTEAGLRRILDRTGWDVVAWHVLGAEDSNPQAEDRDQRVFCAIRSRAL